MVSERLACERAAASAFDALHSIVRNQAEQTELPAAPHQRPRQLPVLLLEAIDQSATADAVIR